MAIKECVAIVAFYELLMENEAKDFTNSKQYGSGHEGAAVLLPGFAIKW